MACYREIGTVHKPYQYIGHEENAYRKDFDQASVRLCLAFPDAYEVGMSNVGMQILYHAINEQPAFLADRVYAPLPDMGEMLRRTGQALQARESSRPLRDFDVLGFTLQYELCYTNILYMLDLAGISRRATQRRDDEPLVIAGGPCAFNPEPVAEFLDLCVIGEGEEVILEVLAGIAQARARNLSRAETLVALQAIKGVYVPYHYTPTYTPDGRFDKLVRGPQAPRWIERRIIKDLNKAPYPTRPVTPSIQPIHERISVEIQRGCTRSCRFCQAGYVYRPRRERKPEKVLDIVSKSIAETGITDVGFLSLSSADYSHIHPLMQATIARFKTQHLSVSLPSTRLEALAEEYLDVLKEERRSGFTIAPEAGSQRLRNVINKNFTEEEVVETARMLFRNGWQTIKMYFMIGQPTETDEDVIAIAELANTVVRRCTDIPGRKQITVSVSNFVPKPHTPFQWHEQISHDEIQRKQRLIRDHTAYKSQISFRCHAADNSLAEGLLARGDRRSALLIERTYEKGAIFDCWQDKFNLSIWLAAAAELLEETGHDFIQDGLRGRDLNERLPWHRIHSGIHPKFFKNEYIKALYGIATEDCSFASCHECGLCNERSGVAPVVYKETRTLPKIASVARADVADIMSLRFQYAKTGAGVYLSTLDLQNIFARAFRRAGIDVEYDNGIRRRPYITLGPALPLGVSSECELLDIRVRSDLSPEEIRQRVNARLPDHLRILTGVRLEPGAPGITQIIRSMSYRVAAAPLETLFHVNLPERVAEITTADRVLVHRERKTRDGDVRSSTVNIKDNLAAIRLDGDWLRFSLHAPGGQPVSPYLVLDAILGARRADNRDIAIHKTGFN